MESLELVRNDLLQTAATRRGTLFVFPSGANQQQKIGVGDLSGVIQCFSVKRQECKTAFKTLPTHNCITAVALGRGASQRDRLFLAENGVIRGLTKKGKEFFRFDTNLTECVSGLFVQDALLVVLGEYTCLVFEDNRERSCYMSPDRINAFDAALVDGQLAIAIACQDRRIRVVDGHTVRHQAPVEGVATCVVYSPESHDPFGNYPEARELLYGTENGILGQLFLDKEGLHRGFVKENLESRGAVMCVFAGIDFTKDGMNDIAVGRDDGYVEIYSMDESGQLSPVFETRLSDRINTLTGGFVTASHVQDLVLQTYSGKVLAYTSEASGLFGRQADGKCGRRSDSQDTDVERLEFLDAQITEMKSQMATLSKHLQEKRSTPAKGASKKGVFYRELVSMVSETVVDVDVNIKQSCRLDPSQNCFILMLEVSKPIFCVALCCDVEIELLAPLNSVAILSQTPSDDVHGFPVLATFRCQEAANRLDIRFRAEEGRPGAITCFILPKPAAARAFSTRHPILPLCLHERVPDAPSESRSEWRLRGNFSEAELCLWFAAALPDFPKQWPTESALYFRSSRSGNALCVQRSDACVQISSRDICALDIVRETLMAESLKRNQNVQFELKPDTHTIEQSLESLWNHAVELRALDENAALSEALHEIRQHEEIPLRDSVLVEVLSRRDAILEQSRSYGQQFDEVAAAICGLVTHYRRLMGSNAAALHRADIDALLHNPDITFEELRVALLPSAIL